MSKKQSPAIVKLAKFREWLKVPEAAEYLSILVFGGDVSEADVLRLALDGHLKISVNFVNHTICKYGTLLTYEKLCGDDGEIHEIERNYPPDYPADKMAECEEAMGQISRYYEGLKNSSGVFDDLDNSVTEIKGVWDLPMIGHEGLDVEQKYQALTDGPEVTLTCLAGTFVEGEDGQICQLQEYIDDNECRPANGLPSDSVLVVRTQTLVDFYEGLSSEESAKKDKPLGLRAETTYLNIIGALLEVISGGGPVMKKHPDFTSYAKLIEHFCDYKISGLSKPTLENKFAAAKRSFSSSIE